MNAPRVGPRLSSLEWLVSLLAALCVLTTAVEFLRPLPSDGDTPPIPSAGAPPESLAPAQKTEPRHFDVITARPLFTTDRRPYRIAVPEAAVPVVDRQQRRREPPPSFALSGVIQTPGISIALLAKDGDDKTHRLRTGDSIDGWTLSEVHNDRVRMQKGGNELLVLLKPDAVHR